MLMLPRVVPLFLILTVANGQILLYNTETTQLENESDCVYYIPSYGEEILYCRRLYGNQLIYGHKNQCNNQGEKRMFTDLLKKEIHPSTVLKWSSSVATADLYAEVFNNRALIYDNEDAFVCNCTIGTFGKYCEYQLTHESKTFSEAVKRQFEQKQEANEDSWNTQRYGRILCYETLPCPSSPLCLDWREICDGIQRCSNGIDEENCDKLEFNECEEDEFRCQNGMCVAEDFWLDGDFDCMDRTDEYLVDRGTNCPFQANAMECDEHLCLTGLYSCGDGQCITWETRMAFQRLGKAQKDCFNKRNINYMCELSQHRPTWTNENGLCWPDRGYDDPRYPSWNMMDTSNLTASQKCQYLFQCALTKGFEHDCPCNHQNCTLLMLNVCSRSDRLIFYPPSGLINSNIVIIYNYTRSVEKPIPQLFLLDGNIKCRGFLFQATRFYSLQMDMSAISYPFMNHVLCASSASNYGYRNFTSPHKNDPFCWNGSQTFNERAYAVYPDICPGAGECISQYRMHDGNFDCMDGDDELKYLERSYCTGNVGRRRFQCFNNQHKCLPLRSLGSGITDCSNNYDETWFGVGSTLRYQLPCFKGVTTNCPRVIEYVVQSSSNNSYNSSLFIDQQLYNSAYRMPFRYYCNTFWDSNQYIDEIPASCKYWICQSSQYQCGTGQCIPFDWVCDGEWDCSDATDEEAFVLIENSPFHNRDLEELSSQLAKCRKRYSNTTFSKICNTSYEFGCYLSGVFNPLDIQLNRPCINLTQIGDGKEDCYNAYDEKNTLISNLRGGGTWGFNFRCDNEEMSYQDVCIQGRNCTHIHCLNNQIRNSSCSDRGDFICLHNNRCMKNVQCDGTPDCFHGEDEYWCPSGTLVDITGYRVSKKQISLQRDERPSQIYYPSENTIKFSRRQLSDFNISHKNFESFKTHSYQCNRGIAVLHLNETRCLCPPAYYGQWCQYFNDRISIIVRIEYETLPKIISDHVLKIKANFLFNHQIIDHHEFHVIPILERNNITKHKFYLLYLRSPEMLTHKQKRYFNRSDLLHDHPYSVHFDIFASEDNTHLEEIGSWHYHIYFDYLPAFRLALLLRVPSWFGDGTFDPCTKNSCNKNSTCLPVLNHNNSYYCSCKSGYYGINCSMYEPVCETYCSTNALCRPDELNLRTRKIIPYCICLSNRFGPRCNLKYEDCTSNPCLNNGSCFSNYDRSGENTYLCRCPSKFEGYNCENERAAVHIFLNMTITLHIRAAVVQLFDYDHRNMMLRIVDQQIFTELPSSIISYRSNIDAPSLGVFKIYEDLSDPLYFLIYFLDQQRRINISSAPQHCPHATLLLSKVSEIDPFVPSVFKYHQICRNKNLSFCFYDENYFCICQQDRYRTECFINDIKHDHCQHCFLGGTCLQGDLENPKDFICYCPPCYRGRLCEFNMQAFGFTLDSILVGYSKKVKIIYVVIVALLFTIGLLSNFCSLVTFKRPIPRKFNVGIYLLISSCLNQIALLCLVFKFIQVTGGLTDVISCKVASYLLSVTTRGTYWFASWIAIDRLLMILIPTSSNLKRPWFAIGISTFTFIILLGMHVHEVIYNTVIQHLSTNSLICVTNFDTNSISVYHRITTFIHYLLPFCIQIVSITLLLILAARNRVKTVGRQMNLSEMLIKQFKAQKELYITPAIIVLSAVPQIILAFSFACIEMNDWQNHTLLASFLISYAPQVLGFILYVLPSTNYKKEFYETLIWKTFLKKLFG